MDSFAPTPQPSVLPPSASNGKSVTPGTAEAAARQQELGTIDMVEAASSNGVAAEVGDNVLLALQGVRLATPGGERTLVDGLSLEVRLRLGSMQHQSGRVRQPLWWSLCCLAHSSCRSALGEYLMWPA